MRRASGREAFLYLHEKHNRTNEYNIGFARFGEAVTISADGNRLVFGGNEVVEVWDWQDEDWVFEYRFEGEFHATADHLRQAGTRIALVQRESDIFNISIAQNVSFDYVVEYDDVSDGKGTEWVQVGETRVTSYALSYCVVTNVANPANTVISVWVVSSCVRFKAVTRYTSHCPFRRVAREHYNSIITQSKCVHISFHRNIISRTKLNRVFNIFNWHEILPDSIQDDFVASTAALIHVLDIIRANRPVIIIWNKQDKRFIYTCIWNTERSGSVKYKTILVAVFVTADSIDASCIHLRTMAEKNCRIQVNLDLPHSILSVCSKRYLCHSIRIRNIQGRGTVRRCHL
jgi:hypothetical protein